MNSVDVIIVNWNDCTNLRAALDSIFSLSEVRRDPEFVRVLVSDNGSTDGSLPLVRDVFGERVRLLENGRNLGFGAGVNRGVEQTRAPYIFLLNPDATLTNGALAELVRFMDAHPRCAMAGPKTFDSEGHLAQSCAEFDTWAGAFLRSSAWGEWPLFARFANGAALRSWDYNSERRVDVVIGAAVLLRRAVFEKLGGFDERYFMYHEEVDLAKRIAQAGYETWFVPSAFATHIGQGSSGGRSVEPMKQRSRRLYWIKHHGTLWYYALVAALVGRYVVYLVLAATLFILVLRAWKAL